MRSDLPTGDIKKQLGVLSTEFHMEYIDYADPSVRAFSKSHSSVSTWEVVCSGFFDCARAPSPPPYPFLYAERA